MPAASERLANVRLAGARTSTRRGLSLPASRIVRTGVETGGLMTATDPRWVLAARTAAWLQGGRAAILSPDRRRSIVAMAPALGLRPFDAALIIAIAQD